MTDLNALLNSYSEVIQIAVAFFVFLAIIKAVLIIVRAFREWIKVNKF